MSTLNRFAVIGHPVSHSLSPEIHQQFGEQLGVALHYEKIEGDSQQFEKQVVNFFADGGQGLNVTLPFKHRAYAMAKVRTKRCSIAKSANTLWVKNGLLHADNTDGEGLIKDLARHIDLKSRRILVLGAGGAASGIIAPLLACQPESLVVANRTLAKAEALKTQYPMINVSSLSGLQGTFDLIINATSMSLQNQAIKLPEAIFKSHPLCYDLAYQKEGTTAFVAHVKALGCQGMDGLGMLVEQAASSFEIWHGIKPDTAPVINSLRRS